MEIVVLTLPSGVEAMAMAAILAVAITLGCLLLTLLQHMVHAKWGILLIDRFEAGGGVWSLIVCSLALLPALLRPDLVFQWSHGGFSGQEWWLSIAFFRLRSVIYFTIWIVLAFLMRKATRSGSYATNTAAPGFFIVAMTGTFASFDWAMSLEPPFASTVYGLLFLTISALGAMGLCVTVTCASEQSPLFDEPLRRDYGNLLFTMLMVWAYLSFMQYIICWSGNLKDEASYFLRRAEAGWLVLGDSLVGLGFFAPFFLLLTPRIRGTRVGLGVTAAFTVSVWFAFVFWLVGPDLPAPWWLDLGAILGVGLMWTAAFARQFERIPAGGRLANA